MSTEGDFPTDRFVEGSLVKIVTPTSKLRGSIGYVYKIHETGRLGVMVKGRKVTYTAKGLILIDPVDKEEVDKGIVAADRARLEYFEKESALSGKERAPSNKVFVPLYHCNKPPDEPPDNNKRSAPADSGRLDNLAKVLQQLQQQVNDYGIRQETGFTLLTTTIQNLARRIEFLESVQNSTPVSLSSEVPDEVSMHSM